MPDSEKTNNSRSGISLSKCAFLMSVTAGVVLIALLVILCITENIEVLQRRSDAGFETVKDYTCREVEAADAPIGIKKEYTFTIDEALYNDTHLAFYTVHQYVDVFLDGQNIYSLKPAGEEQISKTVGSNWVMIPLYREDAGKEIRVEITPVYESFRERKVEFLVGSQLAIYRNRLSKDLPQLILGVMAVFVGIVFICVAGYSMYKRQRGRSLADLGLFSIMMGLWRLTDTRFTPFIISDKPVFLFYVSVTMLMLGMIPLMKWTEEYFTKNSRRIMDGYCILVAFICLLQLILQFFRLVDLREILSITHIIIGLGVLILIGMAVYEKIKYPDKPKMPLGNKLVFICVAGVVADVAAFYIKGNSSGLLFSLLAFLLYIVFMGIATMLNYSEQQMRLAEMDRQLAEQERQLTESRIATMMSQIQPHFIYNTLGTIGQFCLEEPEKAADLVQNFSMYLRGNFVELDNAAPIPLSQELEHVRHYANIEQVRFPDMQIEYDLRSEEFLLPALSVQPLVENAIKHGLMGLEEGGCVVISTYETDKEYCVCVRDNGVGFDQSVFEDGKKHIGIKNIRGRIEAMCGGTLSIESTPGTGTTALITIPKEVGSK